MEIGIDESLPLIDPGPYGGFLKWSYPKSWMVFVRENSTLNWMMISGDPHDYGNLHMRTWSLGVGFGIRQPWLPSLSWSCDSEPEPSMLVIVSHSTRLGDPSLRWFHLFCADDLKSVPCTYHIIHRCMRRKSNALHMGEGVGCRETGPPRCLAEPPKAESWSILTLYSWCFLGLDSEIPWGKLT